MQTPAYGPQSIQSSVMLSGRQEPSNGVRTLTTCEQCPLEQPECPKETTSPPKRAGPATRQSLEFEEVTWLPRPVEGTDTGCCQALGRTKGHKRWMIR